MIEKKLKTLFEKEHVQWKSLKHSPSYTAHETAQSAHVPGKEYAKTLIIKRADSGLAMLVMCANDKINFDLLEKELGGDHVELATEREFQDRFPGCEIGAMPPFGNLYGMPVYVDEHLTHDKQIAFNGGSHSELIQMNYKDFNRIVHPKVLHAA